MTDPFEALARPPEPVAPRAAFAAGLRARVVAELGLDDDDTVHRSGRSPAMSTTTPTDALVATGVTPYLTASDAAAALAWYVDAFAAVEQFRVVGDDGRLGHAEFTIGTARFMLSDEYPEMGVRSPTALGGTPTTLHLSVTDVDSLFARAVAAGATPQGRPADQPHGARHGTLVDPFGHRWMLSQPLEDVDLGTYRERSRGSGFEVVPAPPDARITVTDRPGTGGGIWAGAYYEDALAGIRFLVDVLGFEEQVVVTGSDGRTVVHSELRWPEGGIVQAGTADPGNEFTQPPGGQALYVVTADPRSVWERCLAAGVAVVRPLAAPHHDPAGLGFSVRDPEGNIWSFGTYGLGTG